MKKIEFAFIPMLAVAAASAFLFAMNTISNASSSIIPCGYSRVDGKYNAVVLLKDSAIFVNSYHGSSTGVFYTLEGDVIDGDMWSTKHPEHREWVVDCIQKID